MTSTEETAPRVFRLPTDEEIRAHRGLPSPDEEKQLRELFFQNFEAKAKKFLQEKAPDWKYSQDNLQQILGFFYGIFLTNYVLGGQIIHEKVNAYKAYEKSRRLNTPSEQQVTFSVYDLNDWPFGKIIEGAQQNKNTFLQSQSQTRMSVDSFGNISFPLNSFKATEPNKRYQRIAGVVKIGDVAIKGKYPYTISGLEEKILTGVEEAHHSWRKNRKFFKNNKKDHTVLKNLVSDSGLDSATDSYIRFIDDEQNISYKTVQGAEYAMELFLVQVIQKYMPSVWKSGYEKFFETVKIRRQEYKEISEMMEKAGETITLEKLRTRHKTENSPLRRLVKHFRRQG